MKTIKQAMLEEIYSEAFTIASKEDQVIGKNNDYYITLEQLEKILKEFED